MFFLIITSWKKIKKTIVVQNFIPPPPPPNLVIVIWIVTKIWKVFKLINSNFLNTSVNSVYSISKWWTLIAGDKPLGPFGGSYNDASWSYSSYQGGA